MFEVGREPAHLKPRSRADLAGRRGPHKPERTSFVYKAYVLKTNSSIDTMSIHELPISGGSAHFGTNDELWMTQTVAGTVHEYVYNNGGSYLVCPLSGGVEMTQTGLREGDCTISSVSTTVTVPHCPTPGR